VSRLPVVSCREAVAAFQKVGYEVDHQSGSHLVLRRQTAPHRRLTIPNHREIARGTLRSLIRESGLTVDEFVALL
jgi:predicted RNA binding protein YcfA (HicA-like mRNA interferase family)